ncbi:cell division protein FtsK [Thioclava sp. SK-1]|uniref:DNA translocase FtsK n=1 Tax=Thioclava sp. SK-1 TaxID=1889770 RepID=UPI00082581A5|nr:DNA translocase FtsK [Thioclava sp. SK-1]OCX59842.1 cell division protein FtsK [Thioclava sp. SK-1]
MASFPMRQRDPLFDSNTQAALERRGKELMGAALVFAALLFAMLLGSYSPEDPSWMASSDQPVANWLGRIGAGIASPLMFIIGHGAWLLPAGACAWGLRFILHRGEERVMSRAIFLPLAIALVSVHAAFLEPDAEWGVIYGMGGNFGDMIAGSVIEILGVSSGFGLKFLSALFTVLSVGMAVFVLGFTKPELKTIGRFLYLGSAAVYAGLMTLLGRGASASVLAARHAAERARDRREAARARAAEQAVWDEQQALLQANYDNETYADDNYAPQPVAKSGLLSRIIRPETQYAEPDYADLAPELVEADYDSYHPVPAAAPTEDRIKARIAEAVHQRRAQPQLRAEPALYAPADNEIYDEVYRGQEAPMAWADPEREPVAYAPVSAPVAAPEPEPAAPASVMAAVARRLARGPKLAPAARVEPRIEPTLKVEPPLKATPRFMPGTAPRVATAPPAPRPAAVPPMAQETALGMQDAHWADQGYHMDEIEPMPTEFDSFEVDAFAPLGEEFGTVSARAAAPDTSAEAPVAEAAGYQPLQRRAVNDMPAAIEPEFDPSADDDGDDHGDMAQFGMPDEDNDIPSLPASVRPVGLDRKVIPEAPARRVMAPVKKPIAPSKQAIEEQQPKLAFEPKPKLAYEMPPLNLLTNPASITRHQLADEALEENARMLENVLDDYGVKGEIVSVRPGPVVTMYELEPAPGLKASRVIGLADDIARSMSALSARVSTVPGRTVIGIELPNDHREKVVLREILSARDFGDSNMRLPLALGKDIGGDPIVANLAKMPHLLIAGTTGSGKSVAINTMILSLLYKLSPEECRMIMIDPKMLELSVYDGIPHLLSPVVTDPKKAVVALKWVVGEMEDRYRKMSKMGVRNIEGYNGRVKETLAKGEMFKRTVQTGFDEETGEPVFETDEFQPEPFPYIVVIVDEMADLMMVAGKEIEACIQRLAQMARASGIHLIMATQRPSVDVITGTIKANFPTRISFQVTSKIDSRTILGEQGAEQLLGMGDMLYMGTGSRLTRIHGPFVSDEEVEEIVNHLKSFGPPSYMSGVVEGPEDEKASDIDAVLGLNTGGNTGGEDALYDQAVAIVAKDRKCSTSYIQRKLGIGYNKAARLVEQMEAEHVVSSANHVGKREILIPET